MKISILLFMVLLSCGEDDSKPPEVIYVEVESEKENRKTEEVDEEIDEEIETYEKNTVRPIISNGKYKLTELYMTLNSIDYETTLFGSYYLETKFISSNATYELKHSGKVFIKQGGFETVMGCSNGGVTLLVDINKIDFVVTPFELVKDSCFKSDPDSDSDFYVDSIYLYPTLEGVHHAVVAVVNGEVVTYNYIYERE